MSIIWIYPYAMEVRQAWSTGSCVGSFADIRDILRHVHLSTSTLKGIDPFNVITHGMLIVKDGHFLPRHLVCVRSHCGMAYIHQHHVPHTPTCTAVANGIFTATQRYK
ncbi:hypothetical protein K439DRAFT_1625683, partial [Ramaria rubella]